MKRVLFFILLLFTLAMLSPHANGQQLRRSVFHGSPKMRGDLSAVAYTVLYYVRLRSDIDDYNVLDYNENIERAIKNPVMRWLKPSTEIDFHIPGWSMSQFDEDIPLAAPDWWSIFYPDMVHDYNFSIGYEFSWKSLLMPFGAYFGLDFEWRQLCIDKGTLTGKHRVRAFLPSAGVRLYLLGNRFEREHSWNIVADCGGSYNIPVWYSNFFNWSIDALGRGFRSRLGIGVSTLDYGCLYIRWEKDLYNFFNTDFCLPDGRHPFENQSNLFSSIIVGWSLLI